MANAVKWSALAGATVAVTGTALKSLSDGANKLGTEYDNSTNHNMYADFVGKYTFNTAPAAGAYVALYLLGAPDGTNYEYGGDAVDPAANSWVGNFVVQATSNTHYCVLKHILLPNTKFKPLVMNEGGYMMSKTAGNLRVTFHLYNEEIQ